MTTAAPNLDWARNRVDEAFANTTVGEFLTGQHTDGRTAEHSMWLVTTEFPTIAADLVELLGGTATRPLTTTSAQIAVETQAPDVLVVLDGPEALTCALVQQAATTALVPAISVRFQLADARQLGAFDFKSTSWNLAETIMDVQQDLAQNDGPSLCKLSLQLVRFRARNGVEMAFRKPSLTVLRGL
ncbi:MULTISPECIES: hypothetical protein [unclassified Kitasatospora]|uniref:recombination directionality factor n=1 Tax=unclassified Kitasatospora TaxID=2633591 RepID=UPI0037F14A9D